jgi:hypothetical protein
VVLDASSPSDAASQDAAAVDAGTADAGTGAPDATLGDVGSSDAGTPDVGCPTPVRLVDIQTATFDGCSGRGPMTCHTRDPFQGALDLSDAATSFRSLVGVTSSRSVERRVVAGDPAHSFLWRKLTNNLAADLSEGDPMPKGEAIAWHPLPDDQLNAIRCWIAQGAPQP